MSQGMYGSSIGRESGSSSFGSSLAREGAQQPSLSDHLVQYCRENPASAAMWCFGIGFVLGWRLKPW